MSRNQGMVCGAALALLVAFSAAANAATVAVTVADGAVAVDPAGVQLDTADTALLFELGTAGYVFPTSNAVVFKGVTYSCKTAAGGLSVNCRRTSAASVSGSSFQVSVQPAPGVRATKPQPSPNIWVTSE